MSNFPNNTLSRGIFILDLLSHHAQGLSFKELQLGCGDTASTTLNRLLKPLMASEHLNKNANGNYELGPSYLKSARRALGKSNSEELITEVCKELMSQTGDSSAYFQWRGNHIAILAKSEAPEGLRFSTLGSTNHPLNHAFYEAILPWIPKDHRPEEAGQFPGGHWDDIQSKGFVYKIETFHYPHLRITAPVFYGQTDMIAGSIGVSIPTTELTAQLRSTKIDAILAAAKRASIILSPSHP